MTTRKLTAGSEYSLGLQKESEEPIMTLCVKQNFLGNNTLLTSLARLRYTQLRVGRLSELGEQKSTTHWVGEFMKPHSSSEEENYLYLFVSHTNVHQDKHKKVYHKLPPEIHVLTSQEPLDEVTIPGAGIVTLGKMPWLGLPFSNYYDLPEMSMPEHCLMREYEYHPDNLENIFQDLYEKGYRYRREVVMVGSTYNCQDNHFLSDCDVNPEYLAHNIYQLTLEFVHPVTYCRKTVLISSKEIQVYLCNGHGDADLSHYYSCNFEDQLSDIRHFNDDPATKEAFCEEEIFPEPLLNNLLKKYQLIDRDQIIIRHHMENREFCHWFSYSIPEFCYWLTEKDFIEDEQYAASSLDDIIEQNKENVARCRRIFYYLRYPLTDTLSIHDGNTTIEIYANSTKERAFFLIYDEYNYFVRFVDKYMDVNGALTF